MLDVASVLQPSPGVVAAQNSTPLLPGSAPLWSVGALIDCEHVPDPETVLHTCVAGACSLSRSRASVRTAGEVVERLALHGSAGTEATMAELGDEVVDFFTPENSLAAHPGTRRLRWYAGWRASDSRPTRVPAGLVDYPAADEDRVGFDPGPSGAASGIGAEQALKSALLETIERDAVIVAWARQLELCAVDIDVELARRDDDPIWDDVRRTVAMTREHGLDVVFAEVPSSVDGVVCIVGGVRGITPDVPQLCLGAKASDHPGRAVLGALEESFQLHFGLRNFEMTTSAAPAVVTNEEDRLRFVSSRSGLDALEAWLETRRHARLPDAPRDLSIGELLTAMRSDGTDPVLVDLSDWLPMPLQERGWAVMKVVPVGYQPLRIDERHEFGWHEHRLANADARTGSTARTPEGTRCSLPHPLP